MITSLSGDRASRLGLAANPKQDPRCVRKAFQGGINFFFFYGPGYPQFIHELASLIHRQREAIILATGSGARRNRSLVRVRRKLLAALGAQTIDLFFAEYVNASDDEELVFGRGGVLLSLIFPASSDSARSVAWRRRTSSSVPPFGTSAIAKR